VFPFPQVLLFNEIVVTFFNIAPSTSRLPVLSLLLIGFACSGAATPPSATLAATSAPVDRQAVPVAAPNDEVAATVDKVLAAAELPGLTWASISDVVSVLKPLYDAEPDRLFWFDGTVPAPVLASTVAALATAPDHGLDARDYDAAPLAERWTAIKAGTSSGRDRALFDVGVSVAVARILRAVHSGRVDPATMEWGYNVAPRRIDRAAALRDVRQGKPLAGMLDALEPPFSHYARARRTLVAYKKLLQAGEPELVPALPKGRTKVTPRQTWEGVPQLAARLRVFGDLAADPSAATHNGSTAYDETLVKAVKSFQGRHGLEPDGVIGAGTIKTLNVPLAQRVRQIELAMERMRWLPTLSDRPNVFVNVPLFRMWATDPATGEEPLRMNVVVGKSLNHQTPLFVDQMEYVIFRPYWNPPRSITVNEIIPKVRRDPAYFDREGLEIVASGADDAPALPPTPDNLSLVASGKLTIRQRPGPTNSLGLAKFIFPNDDNVYMHGTPAQQLFSRARRDFSHGCIRLEDPARFAEWVLRDQPDWSRDKIDAAMQGQRPTRVSLKQPLTVVLFYDTVHVNSENVVFFVDDVYGHDRALDAMLARGYPYPEKH
jgi:murein L,D-transpeptidase YcbB/YkuD